MNYRKYVTTNNSKIIEISSDDGIYFEVRLTKYELFSSHTHRVVKSSKLKFIPAKKKLVKLLRLKTVC